MQGQSDLLDIMVIADTQVKKDTCIEHIKAAGRAIVEEKPDVVVVGGDWWDTPSLSNFNSKRESEGLRLKDDIKAGVVAMQEFLKPLRQYQKKLKSNKKKQYKPRLVFITGNHDLEVRVNRLYEDMPQLEGTIMIPSPSQFGFEVYPFLEVVNIQGINFSHYICNPHSLKSSPLSGNIDTMLKNAGFSFVMFHQQTFKYGKHVLSNNEKRIGVVAGSFYSHDEKYMGPQGNKHWRGIFFLRDAGNGNACLDEFDMDRIMRRYS